MNPGLYTNGFTPGETVKIDMPGTSFNGKETVVVRPRSIDILEPEDVLVKNPNANGWILRLHENCLLKSWDNGLAGPAKAMPARAAAGAAR